MTTLPPLKSGQIVQYPLRRRIQQNVDAVQFLDGSEQRCATTRALRQWTIKLDLLDEQELSALSGFVLEQQTENAQFAFTDPCDGITYTNCSFAFESWTATHTDQGRMTTELIIRENVD